MCVPYHFSSVPGPRKTSVPSEICVRNLCAFKEFERRPLTFFFTLFDQADVVAHRHEDDPIFEFFWFDSACHAYLNIAEQFHCGVSWEKFTRNSNGSPSIPCNS